MAALEGWLKHHQMYLHPSLSIVQDEQGCSIRASAPIEPSTSVARIPKSTILSQRTCSLGAARLAQLPPQLPETLRLAVCLLHEQLLGVESRWTDYIRSLPSTTVPIALLWPVDGEARRWAQGTELAKVLDQVQQDERTLATFFTTTLLPFFRSAPPPSSSPTLSQFLHAYSLVSSRAFQVDSWHGLSLVPLADIFNHTDEHDVHFESETWVCAECGALHACEHDDEELREGRAVEMTLDAVEEEEEDCCELVSVRGIEAGQKVFNSYGELSNSRLLAFYGFALEANRYDRITFAMDDVLRLAPTPPPASVNIAEDLGSLVKEWVSTHNSSSPFPETEEEDDPIIHDPTSHLYIDADAHLSSSLWLLLLLLHIPLPTARTKRHELLLRLKSAQCRRVHGAELQEEEAELGALDERALHLLVGAVRTLCAARVREQCAEEKTGAELLELAGTTTDEPNRQAIELLASERILLACVSETWVCMVDDVER